MRRALIGLLQLGALLAAPAARAAEDAIVTDRPDFVELHGSAADRAESRQVRAA